jgi:hypothetical protein
MPTRPGQTCDQLTSTDKVDLHLADRREPDPELLAKLELVPEQEIQNLGNVTKNTTEMWQRRRKGPPRVRFGNRYYYTIPTLKQHIQEKLEEQG